MTFGTSNLFSFFILSPPVLERCLNRPLKNDMRNSRKFSDRYTASGKGAELTSVDGDTYVDFLGEYTAGLFGHSNQVIAEAIGEAMTKGWSFGGPNVYERRLAKKVS